jgi:hypothetical protein
MLLVLVAWLLVYFILESGSCGKCAEKQMKLDLKLETSSFQFSGGRRKTKKAN